MGIGGGVGGGLYSNVNPYAGGVGYSYDGYGVNPPYGNGYGYVAYGAPGGEIGNEDLTRRQFIQQQQQQIQQRRQQQANLQNAYSYDYDYNSPGLNYNNPALNYDYDYSAGLNYNSNPYQSSLRGGYGGQVRRGRSVGVEDLIAQESQAGGEVLAPPPGLLGEEMECRDTLNPNAVLVLASAAAVVGGVLYSTTKPGAERRGEEADYLKILTEAISKYS